MLNKEDLKKIKNIKGQIRGTTFKNDFDYVAKKEGKIRIMQIKDRLKELNCENGEICRGEIKTFSWYPLWCHVLFLVVLNKEFNWSEKDIFNIGYNGPRVSVIFKAFPKSFVNLKKIFNQSNKFWKKHYTVGEVEMKECNLEKKYVIFDIKKFNAHPLECVSNKGYLTALTEIFTGSKKVETRETKCLYKGDDFHRFKINWN